jgi:hypothetical protein
MFVVAVVVAVAVAVCACVQHRWQEGAAAV